MDVGRQEDLSQGLGPQLLLSGVAWQPPPVMHTARGRPAVPVRIGA